MPTFHQKLGIAPQIEVPMNITEESSMAARRPYRSASAPHTKEPTTVPASAAKGSQATVATPMPYSARIPGVTKPRLAGFMISMISARASKAATVQCRAVSGAFSGGEISSTVSWARCATFGSSPKPARAMPPTMANMPMTIDAPMGMPASM